MDIDLELLSIQNPWWRQLGTGERLIKSLDFDPVIKSFASQPLKWKPKILSELDLGRDNTYVLYGGRGLGKTTILKLLIKKLVIEKKTEPDNIFYYSCHNLDTYEELNELVKIFLNWRRTETDKRLFIFIDEISLIKNWPKGFYYLAKAKKLKKVTVVLASSRWEKFSNKAENLPTRDKIIASLDFAEFVRLFNPKLSAKVNKNNYKNYQDQLEYYLDIYFLTGGFLPCLNSFQKEGMISQNIYNDYFYSLTADIAKLGRDVILLRQILEQVILNLGQPLGYKTIAHRTKAKIHLTIAEYLEILESMFVIKMVYQSDSKGKPTSRKAKKIYFIDPFLFWLFYSHINGSLDYWQTSRERLHRQDVFNALVENVVFSHLVKNGNGGGKERLTYWRDNIRKQEISFLVHQGKKIMPVLLHYGREIEDKDLKIFKQAGFGQGIIISRERMENKDNIKILPLTYFLLFHKELLK
ncbi:MAG: ATP-binding protein [Patescibacteria group bacterium]|nr:ATP-binding protein [Patescibacteria group bacterium]MDD5294658.1 ATP-binding protein [Patescibacteria group bacterium]MDD5554709.1 ATP-binding protein [Patescibacteria group bacterium]